MLTKDRSPLKRGSSQICRHGIISGCINMSMIQWIGLRENLNRKPWFLPSNWSGFPVNFPIIQFYEWYNKNILMLDLLWIVILYLKNPPMIEICLFKHWNLFSESYLDIAILSCLHPTCNCSYMLEWLPKHSKYLGRWGDISTMLGLLYTYIYMFMGTWRV